MIFLHWSTGQIHKWDECWQKIYDSTRSSKPFWIASFTLGDFGGHADDLCGLELNLFSNPICSRDHAAVFNGWCPVFGCWLIFIRLTPIERRSCPILSRVAFDRFDRYFPVSGRKWRGCLG